MRFALLGIDADAWKLVRSICASEAYQLAAVCNVTRDVKPLRGIAPEAKWHDGWEVLLTEGVADAVIVARPPSPGEHDDPLRKLVQKGLPLLVVHPASEALLCYELDMIQHDIGGLIMPYVPDRLHPAIARLEDWTLHPANSPIGMVEQVVFERAMSDRAREVALLQFARDIELVTAVCGKIQHVSAMGPSKDDEQFGNLSVQMKSCDDKVARWSIRASTGDLPSTLTLIGSAGQSTLRIPIEDPWQLEASGTQPETFHDYDDGEAVLEAFVQAYRGKPAKPDWPQACRDIEIVDAIPRSLRRGRTIEILDEQHSEEQSFKGIMAAGGCAILLGVLAVIFILALVDGLTMPHRDADLPPVAAGDSQRLPFAPNLRDPDRPHVLLRIWPVYPIAIFLLLQFFRLIIRKDGGPQSDNPKPTTS